MVQRTSTIIAFGFLAVACSKKDGDSADAAGALANALASAMASASSSATPAADAPKPSPPADADKSCTPTPTKLKQDKEDIVVEYNVKNTGSAPWHYCHVNGFGYDKTGKLVARGMLSDNIKLAPGAGHDTSLRFNNAETGKPIDLATAQSLSYELLPARIIWDDKSEWESKDNGFSRKAAAGPTITFGKDGMPAGGGAKAAGSAGAAAASAKPGTTAAAKPSAAPAKPAATPAKK